MSREQRQFHDALLAAILETSDDASVMTQMKRSHEEVESEAQPLSTFPANGNQQKPMQMDANAEPSSEWQVAESRSSKRRKKLPRKESDKYPSITHSSHARLQSVVKISDLQNLALYLIADGSGPQWCSIKNHANVRKVVVLMVPGLDMDMFDQSYIMPMSIADANAGKAPDGGEMNGNTMEDHHEGEPISFKQEKKKTFSSPDDFYPKSLRQAELSTSLQPLAHIFEHVWPIKTPGDDKHAKLHSPLAAMLTCPIAKDKTDKVNGKGPSAPAEAKRWDNQRTAITEYIASPEDLLMEGYVMHPAHFADDESAAQDYQKTRNINKTSTSDGWLDTPNISALADGTVPEARIEKGAVTVGRSVLAIDCEMCITSPPDVQPPVYSLTRMSAVDWSGDVVLDELVKPADPITNYLTAYSGITAKMLEGVTTTLQDAQQKLLAKITPHTILIGHSLVSDLNALRLSHPFIIDTALLYPHPRGPPLKSSLKWLSQKYLSREIQTGHGSTGHNSIEDAKASLDLVRQKCEKGKRWGTNEASSESIFQRLAKSIRPKRYKLHPDGEDERRLGAVVDWGDPKRGFGSSAEVAISCKDDADVVAGIKRAISGDDFDTSVPAGGVDFVWARLRELEAHRQWWSSSKTLDVEALREAAIAKHAQSVLGDVVAETVSRIKEICDALPSCTALIMYTGSDNPRNLAALQELKQRHKAEYAVKKWDELSVNWTDAEEQELRRACETARRGIGFITVK